ncbi:RTA1 like protein-domain-containing protein [Aspergillus keveii]|uniref:RTA1 like protein-domain-containing protein n=1 Tax=Aspergillus keveii TaxID=714993 RepID=A0ABR4FSN6_9EURO
MGYQYYHYEPSVIATIPFAVLFALTSVIHLWQMIRPRTWYMIPFIIGALFEALGYVFRYISARQTPNWTMKPYVGQQVLILLGPALFAASIYMLLGRIIRVLNASSISPIRVNWLSKIFVSGDVISFMLQGGGGGILATAKTAHKSQMGQAMILGGLLVQIIFFGLFIVTSIIFHRRMLKTPLHQMGTSIAWVKYLRILYFISALIMIRSIYRVAEYAEGMNGALAREEALIYILDALLMLICCAVLNVFHPSKVVSGRQLDYRAREDVEMRTGYQPAQ